MSKRNREIQETGLTPVKIDKTGPLYDSKEVEGYIAKAINSDDYFERQADFMTTDLERAVKLTDDVSERFSLSINKFNSTSESFIEKSKKASGGVRDAADKLAKGLAKVEGAANFDRLERYVELLERASVAMNALSELENSGKLEKISAALKLLSIILAFAVNTHSDLR